MPDLGSRRGAKLRPSGSISLLSAAHACAQAGSLELAEECVSRADAGLKSVNLGGLTLELRAVHGRCCRTEDIDWGGAIEGMQTEGWTPTTRLNLLARDWPSS